MINAFYYRTISSIIFINFAPKYKCYKIENSIVGREKEITELNGEVF